MASQRSLRLKYFEQTPEMPGHYKIKEAYRVTSSDLLENDFFRFSRIIQKNYIQDYGILVQNGIKRIQLFAKLGTDIDEFMKELFDLMVEDTMTILHYCPAGYIDVVITGVKPTTYGELPERFKELYYN